MTSKHSTIFSNAVSRVCEEDKISFDLIRNSIGAERFDKISKYVSKGILNCIGDLWGMLCDNATDIIQEEYNNRIEKIRQQGYEEGLIAGKTEAILLSKGLSDIMDAINEKST